jgi:ribonucleotide monophosphatase NagD (HAD superfamily)
VRFGVCFDVDGVLARGSVPIPAAVEAFKRLCDDNGVPKYPVAFVTNSLSSNSEKAEILSRILQAQVRMMQMLFIHCLVTS